MKPPLVAEFVRRAIAGSIWDFGNKVLYDLCAQYPGHASDDVVVAKVWLIGRSYAATIERKRDSATKMTGDEFYQRMVAPQIRSSAIDDWLCRLRQDKGLDSTLSLEIHHRLTGLFREISGIDKRSLASKYLHFHFPDRFFIYDSRADASISSLTKSPRLRVSGAIAPDQTYARFWLRCEKLNDEMARLVGRRLTPRELDKVLLAVSEGAGSCVRAETDEGETGGAAS